MMTMGNIMQMAEDFLDTKLFGFASEEVEYRPNGVAQWKIVNAIIGNSLFKASTVSGTIAYIRSVDFIISANELGQEPEKGDLILRNGQLYEVYMPNDEPCWLYSGDNQNTYRIHTQAIGADEYRPLEIS